MVVLDASVVIIALPVGPAGPAHLDGQPPVDADGLHPRLRRPAAAGRPHRRLLRAQADVHHRPHRLRRRLGPRRPGPELGHALQRPRPAGRLRRRDGAGRAVPAHRDLHRAQGAGPGLRRLRRHRRRRRRHRPHPRRHADRVRLVALDPSDQRAHRHRGCAGRLALRLREPGLGHPRLRHPRRGDRDRGPAGPGLRLHQGRHRRLGLVDHRRPCSPWPRCCSWPSSSSSSVPPNPLLPLRVVLDRNRGGSFLASLLVGTAHLGHLPVPHVLLPRYVALLGAEVRLRLRALLARHHLRRHRGQPAAPPLRATGAADRRPARAVSPAWPCSARSTCTRPT